MQTQIELLNLIRQQRKTFSKGQKSIADYILKNYDKAAFMTAAQLGEKVGVSESTVVRFPVTIGLSGYPELQRQLSGVVREKIRSIDRIEIADCDMPREQILTDVLKSDADKIMLTLESVDRQAFDAAVDSIMSAHHVYVVGLRSCGGIAAFLTYYLKLVRDDVIQITSTNTNEILQDMMHISSDDAVIGISFPRYSMATLKAMEFANDRSARIIAITDNRHSPINMYSSCNLFAHCDMASIVDSLTAPLSIINALIVALCMENREKVLDNIHTMENVLGNYRTGDNDDIDLVNEDALEELGRYLRK